MTKNQAKFLELAKKKFPRKKEYMKLPLDYHYVGVEEFANSILQKFANLSPEEQETALVDYDSVKGYYDDVSFDLHIVYQTLEPMDEWEARAIISQQKALERERIETVNKAVKEREDYERLKKKFES